MQAGKITVLLAQLGVFPGRLRVACGPWPKWSHSRSVSGVADTRRQSVAGRHSIGLTWCGFTAKARTGMRRAFEFALVGSPVSKNPSRAKPVEGPLQSPRRHSRSVRAHDPRTASVG